jgi:hypothetical protein
MVNIIGRPLINVKRSTALIVTNAHQELSD